MIAARKSTKCFIISLFLFFRKPLPTFDEQQLGVNSLDFKIQERRLREMVCFGYFIHSFVRSFVLSFIRSFIHTLNFGH